MKANRRFLMVAGAIVLIAIIAATTPVIVKRVRQQGREPRQVAGQRYGVAYVNDATCFECHKKEFERWSGSNHSWAMRLATKESVLADFNDTSFDYFGTVFHFFTRGSRYFVNAEGADGQKHDFEVSYTFGFDPLQQYLIKFPGGKLQTLTVAWDVKNKRWFHLYPNERIQPTDPLHWTSRYQNWNLMCAECHTTNLQKNYDVKSDSYRTTWAEMNVGCQACHGPGAAHLDWANFQKSGDGPGPEPGSRGLQINFRDMSARQVVESCAPCHARRHVVAPSGVQGTQFLDFYSPELIRPGLYSADGEQQDEVYVYGSFLQSKMYKNGVRCTDCHDPHTSKLKRQGNAVCTECHRSNPPERFGFPAAMRKEYDTPAHHHKEQGSPEARCIVCHMPSRTYMGVDDRQDHSFRVPGRLNYHGVFSAAWNHDPTSVDRLAAMAANTGEYNPYVRASALDALKTYGPASVAPSLPLVKDLDPIVRIAAVSNLDNADPRVRLSAVPLLKDPVRAVRIEAARVLAGIPQSSFTEDERRNFQLALDEFRAAQYETSDMASSWLNLGAIAESLGDTADAERAYKQGIAIDPWFLPNHLNLGNLYNRLSRNAEAEATFRNALGTHPNEAELHYELGLLLAELKRLPEATTQLQMATDLAPSRARIRYNYALALFQIGRPEEGRKELIKASQVDPTDADIQVTLRQVTKEPAR